MHVTGVPESFTIQPLEASLAKNLLIAPRPLSRYFKILTGPERRTLYDLHTLRTCMHAANILVRILSSQTVLQGGL